MKKLKKLLAGVLTLAMAMSMMTMTAFAAPNIDPGTEEAPTTGSITIHKYSYNGTSSIKGTGIEAETLPDGAEPLKGATFTIYRVVNDTDLLDYYSGKASAKYDGSWDVEKYVDVTNNAIKEGVTYDESHNDVTGADGKIEFKDLPLGIYAVIETTPPDSVGTPVKPFLVSIPMTHPNQTEWLYDIHVYPKNSTDSLQEAIELYKYGKEAGADEDKKDPLQGVEFVLQKKMTYKNGDGTTYQKWTTITKNAKDGNDNTGDDLTLVTDVDGKISVTGLTAGEYRFIETSLGEDAANAGYIMDGAAHYEFTIFREGGKLKVTYKADNAVRDTDNSLKDEVTDNNAASAGKHPHFEVINEKPKFDKEIKDSNKDKDNNSNYGVGDIIEYSIAVGVPEKIAKMKYFYVMDTPTNLAIDKDSVKVYYMEGETKTQITDGITITATGPDATKGNAEGFILEFAVGDGAAINAHAGKEITIEYNATVLIAALNVLSQTNDAKLTYTDKITPKDDEDNPNPEDDEKVYVREDKTNSYTYKFKIAKTADSEDGDALKGVEFDLYKDVTGSNLDENYLTEQGLTIIDATTAKGLGLDESKTWLKVNKTKLITDDDGVVEQGGLGNGTYFLVETKTADGYNLLEEPFEVKLTLESSTTVSHTWTKKDTYTDGKLTHSGVWVEECTVSTHTYDDATAEGIFEQPVINRKGFTLPSTGGMGTFLFTFVGVAMMAAAVILFFTSKKKEAK